MEKIASFTVNHLTLLPGVYVSRRDNVGNTQVTTFDIRMTRPNFEPVMNTAEIHTIEHLGATFLRNNKEYGDITVYFGPMGCQTGFYLLVRDAVSKEDVLSALKDALEKTISHEGDVFGASQIECGNYKNLDIALAKAECKKYLEILNSYTPDFKYE